MRDAEHGLRVVGPRMRRDHLIKDALHSRAVVRENNARWVQGVGELEVLRQIGVVDDTRDYEIGERVRADGATVYRESVRRGDAMGEGHVGTIGKDARAAVKVVRVSDASRELQYGAYDWRTRQPIRGLYY